MIYLDANATEPLRPGARDAVLAAMAVAGNPSSRLAAKLSARAQDIVFTSGATEANALAIHALGAGRKILIGATEHDAIRAAAPDAVVVPVAATGCIDLDSLEILLTAHPGALVCLMAANNETGVVHPMAEAAGICARHGAVLHVDAVQAVGRANQDWLSQGAASFAISGHKFGGPMGAGALVTSAAHTIVPLIQGGGQEQNRRGGTPSLPAIAGMAAALDEPYEGAKIAAYRNEIEAFCVSMGAVVIGRGAPRLPNTVCLAYPGVRADTQLIALDMAGFAVSAGAACSSGRLAASHVLTAMGFAAIAGNAIRISLPWNVGLEAVPAFNAAYETMINRALQRGGRKATETATADF